MCVFVYVCMYELHAYTRHIHPRVCLCMYTKCILLFLSIAEKENQLLPEDLPNANAKSQVKDSHYSQLILRALSTYINAYNV